jgi:integrase/recombinase XerC
VGLDLEDVNLGSRMVRVMGKGRKERLVPFNRSASEAIRAWLPDRDTLGLDGERRAAGSRR